MPITDRFPWQTYFRLVSSNSLQWRTRDLSIVTSGNRARTIQICPKFRDEYRQPQPKNHRQNNFKCYNINKYTKTTPFRPKHILRNSKISPFKFRTLPHIAAVMYRPGIWTDNTQCYLSTQESHSSKRDHLPWNLMIWGSLLC
jgi:hypothetical protein